MKPLRMLGRSIRDALKSSIRNFSLSLASISCITITLIIVAVAIIASVNVEKVTEKLEKDLTIVVFMENDVTDEEIEHTKEMFSKIKNIDSYKFKSKLTVKEEMKKESDVLGAVLDNFESDESPLKDTFQIKVKEIENIKDTAETIEKLDKIAVVRYGEGMVDKLIKAFSSIQKVTYGIVIALVLVTIFLIINTIKLTISARKREISIMRLVGASNFTIKTPFIIEGMILGIFGSIIPIILTIFGYKAFYNHFGGHLFSRVIILIKPEPFSFTIALIILGIGILVGMIGSASAVKKYLKV